MKVQTWVDGIEDGEFVGVGARFGTTIVSKEKNANQTGLTLSDPRDCCTAPKNKVFLFLFSFFLTMYVSCTFFHMVTHIKTKFYTFPNTKN